MEYLIREAEEKDLPQLIQLCSHHAAYEDAEYNNEGKLEGLKEALFSEPKKLHCLVVEAGVELAGYASFTFDFSTWHAATFLYLDCLYLEPLYRGHRIGEELMERIKQIAAKKGCINIQWQTPVFNHRAISFYRRIGAKGKEKVRFFLDHAQ